MSVMMTSNASVPSAGNMEDVFSCSRPTLRDHFEAFLYGQKNDPEETKVGSGEPFVSQTHQKVSLPGEEIRIKTESSTCVGSGESFVAQTHQKVSLSGEEMRIKTESSTCEVAEQNYHLSSVPIKTEKPDEEARTDCETYVDRLNDGGVVERPVIKSEKCDLGNEGVSCELNFHLPRLPDNIKIKQEKEDTVCIKTEKEYEHHNGTSDNQVINSNVDTCVPPVKIEADKSCDNAKVVVKTEKFSHANDVTSQQLRSDCSAIDEADDFSRSLNANGDNAKIVVKTEKLSHTNDVTSQQPDCSAIDEADDFSHRHNANGDISKTLSTPEDMPLNLDGSTAESNEPEYNHYQLRERKAKKLAKMMLKELEEKLDFVDEVGGKHLGSLQKSDTYISYSSNSSVSGRLQDLNNEFNKYKDMFSLQECSVKVQRLSEEVLFHYGVNASVLIPEKKTHLEILKKGLFPCSKCSFRSDHLLTLQRHLKSKHPERSYHKCLECDYLANWSESLAHHVKRVHRKERPFQCQHCNHACATRQELKTHEVTHTGDRPFKCPQCEYRASHKGSIKIHLYTHTGEKPFVCPHCSYRCTQYPHLKSHLYIHANTWPFECKLCSYKTRQSSHLRTHMKLIHTSSRPYKCRFCKYASKAAHSLKCHERRHTGEKPYSCHLCPYEARQGTPLRTHIRTKHAAASSVPKRN